MATLQLINELQFSKIMLKKRLRFPAMMTNSGKRLANPQGRVG